MDNNSSDTNVKKLALEDLSREELLVKCKNLLVIAQRAKQAKDVLNEENNKLKEELGQQQTFSSEEVIGKLTQQKVDLLTSLEELKSEKACLNNKIIQCKSQLHDAEAKISDLEISNQSYKRRVDRLTEENEQLISQLDELGQQIDELKTVGLHQQQQLLVLEKNNLSLKEQNRDSSNSQVVELQNTLSTNLEEMKHLNPESIKLSDSLISMEVEKEKILCSKCSQLLEKSRIHKYEELEDKIKELQNALSQSEVIVNNLKQDINNTNVEAEENTNLVDDLKIELHRNRALVEKLKQDIINMNQKLADNQIMSSGVTSDLQNANEKLREKLKSYHMKIVKFAADIKQLKQSKVELVLTFKMYTSQVSEWQERLCFLLDKIENYENQNKKFILQNQQFSEIINTKTNENTLLLEQLKEVEKYKEYLEENKKLMDLNISLRTEVNSLQQRLKSVEQEMLHYKQENTDYIQLEKTIQELQEKCTNFEERSANQEEYALIIETLQAEKTELTAQFQECYANSQKLIEENNKLKSSINDTTYQIGELQQQQPILENLKQELNASNIIVDNYKKEIANLNNNYRNIIMEKENLEKSLKYLQEEYCNLEVKNLELCSILESTKQEYECKMKELEADFQKEKDIVLAQYTTCKEESEKLIKENCELEKCIQKYVEENTELFAKMNILKSDITDLHTKLNESQDVIESLSNELNGNKKEIADLGNLNKSLKDQVNNTNKHEQQLAEKSGEEILSLVKEKHELMNVIKDLEAKTESVSNRLFLHKGIQTLNDLHNIEETINPLKRENAELLSEMNEMNQAIKERGETISIQETQYQELLKEFQAYETQFKNNKDIISEKEELILSLRQEINCLTSTTFNPQDSDNLSKKEEEINQLKTEVQDLRDKLLSISQSDLASDVHYAESDNMSTSTISKTEEVNRMKDLDSSWEERYAKLRNFAVKLKGKIRDLTADLQKEQADKADLHQKQVKIIQTFQQQIDKLQDDLETSKTDCKQYLKKLDAVALDLSKDKKQLAENEEVIAQLKSEIDELNKERTNTENWKKQVSAKVQALKKEQEANNLLKKEFENRINKLNAELESKDKALKQEIERHNQTKTVLQESNNECKKQSVLNLEMQDYERSIKDLSQKIERKQELINKLKTQLETQKTSLNTLKDQNQILEESIKSWEDKYDKINSENEFNKKKINEFENTVSEKENKLQDLTYMVENIRSDNEDLSTQLSKTIADHQKANASLKGECDLLKSRNMGLEQSLRKVQDTLKMKEQLFSEMQTEYESYKVRAQSVLRQNHNRDVGTEEKLTEEAASLRAQVDILTSRLKEVRLNLDEVTTNNNKLQADRENLLEKIGGLEASVENHRKSYEQLTLKHQQVVSEHAETVRGLKIHSDTLVQCYRQQLSEQESRHNREIIELQSKMDRGSTPPENSIILPSMPREEGEGSESVDSNPNNGIQPVPLEKLLGSDTEHDIVNVRKQLAENESKVVHLTALLADTEQDLAKFVQLNNVLKEEIRRQQRSAEREKHAENLEYLKNVVFKFITLGNGDERSRLVPVLNTILKLSPEETQKLNNVAKGEKGWSNYLPISWGSPSKPH